MPSHISEQAGRQVPATHLRLIALGARAWRQCVVRPLLPISATPRPGTPSVPASPLAITDPTTAAAQAGTPGKPAASFPASVLLHGTNLGLHACTLVEVLCLAVAAYCMVELLLLARRALHAHGAGCEGTPALGVAQKVAEHDQEHSMQHGGPLTVTLDGQAVRMLIAQATQPVAKEVTASGSHYLLGQLGALTVLLLQAGIKRSLRVVKSWLAPQDPHTSTHQSAAGLPGAPVAALAGLNVVQAAQALQGTQMTELERHVTKLQLKSRLYQHDLAKPLKQAQQTLAQQAEAVSQLAGAQGELKKQVQDTQQLLLASQNTSVKQFQVLMKALEAVQKQQAIQKDQATKAAAVIALLQQQQQQQAATLQSVQQQQQQQRDAAKSKASNSRGGGGGRSGSTAGSEAVRPASNNSGASSMQTPTLPRPGGRSRSAAGAMYIAPPPDPWQPQEAHMAAAAQSTLLSHPIMPASSSGASDSASSTDRAVDVGLAGKHEEPKEQQSVQEAPSHEHRKERPNGQEAAAQEETGEQPLVHGAAAAQEEAKEVSSIQEAAVLPEREVAEASRSNEGAADVATQAASGLDEGEPSLPAPADMTHDDLEQQAAVDVTPQVLSSSLAPDSTTSGTEGSAMGVTGPQAGSQEVAGPVEAPSQNQPHTEANTAAPEHQQKGASKGAQQHYHPSDGQNWMSNEDQAMGFGAAARAAAAPSSAGKEELANAAEARGHTPSTGESLGVSSSSSSQDSLLASAPAEHDNNSHATNGSSATAQAVAPNTASEVAGQPSAVVAPSQTAPAEREEVMPSSVSNGVMADHAARHSADGETALDSTVAMAPAGDAADKVVSPQGSNTGHKATSPLAHAAAAPAVTEGTAGNGAANGASYSAPMRRENHNGAGAQQILGAGTTSDADFTSAGPTKGGAAGGTQQQADETARQPSSRHDGNGGNGRSSRSTTSSSRSGSVWASLVSYEDEAVGDLAWEAVTEGGGRLMAWKYRC